ncbi:MAG: hypothetical protein ACK5TC_00605 [bacterium]
MDERKCMDRIGNFLIGFLAGTVALYAVMHFTLIRADDGFHLIPKIAAKLDVPFEDVRGMKLRQWQKKQPLALAIVRAQKGHLLKDPSLLAFKENAKQVLDRYQGKTALTGG